MSPRFDRLGIDQPARSISEVSEWMVRLPVAEVEKRIGKKRQLRAPNKMPLAALHLLAVPHVLAASARLASDRKPDGLLILLDALKRIYTCLARPA